MSRPPTVRALVLFLAGAILALSACGSGNDPSGGSTARDARVLGTDPGPTGAIEVYTAWWAALGRGDGAAACALMDTDGKADMDDLGTAGSCENAVRVIHGYAGEPDRLAVRNLDVPSEAVVVDDDEATVDQSAVTSTAGAWEQTGSDVLRYRDNHWWIHDVDYG
jgi:hypothetical protein